MTESGRGARRTLGFFAQDEPGRKGEILDAALEVFAERGYDAGSMREIAARVGVSEPALYRHFVGKEAILLTLLRISALHLRTETLDLIGRIGPAAPRTQLVRFVRDRRKALRLYAPVLRLILPMATRNERVLAEYRAEIVDPIRAKLTEKAAEIDSALEVPDADATRSARVRSLLSLMVGYMVSSFVIGDELDEAIVDSALRVMGWDARP